MTPPVTAAYRGQRRLYWRWTAPGIIFLKEGQVTVTLRSGVGFFIWDECLLHFLKVGGNYQVKLKTASECREVGPCLLNWRGREDWQEHELQRAREKGLDLKDFPGLPSMCLVSEGMRFTPAPLSSPSSLSESTAAECVLAAWEESALLRNYKQEETHIHHSQTHTHARRCNNGRFLQARVTVTLRVAGFWALEKEPRSYSTPNRHSEDFFLRTAFIFLHPFPPRHLSGAAVARRFAASQCKTSRFNQISDLYLLAEPEQLKTLKSGFSGCCSGITSSGLTHRSPFWLVWCL